MDWMTIRITCREDKLDRLLADLAIKRLDLVISDSPMPSPGHKVEQKLGECGISFLPLMRWLTCRFPQCLQGAPLLIPGPETVLRSRLLRWLSRAQFSHMRR